MQPATVFAMATLGIAAIVFFMPSAMPWLRPSRAVVPVLPSGPGTSRARPSERHVRLACAHSPS